MKMKITFENIPPLDFQGSEAYKTLRTNIQFCGEDVKVVLFTSCQPNEGKSVLTFRLSASMGESGKRILLLDTDIRKSILAYKYSANIRAKGLSEYLIGQCELEECVHETNMENVSIMMTGAVAPNPAELLGSEKFKHMIGELRGQYDYILIDCPPLGNVIDAAIISTVCDGAVMVIEDGADSYKFVRQVKDQLEKSGCKILGAVLNKVELEGKGYYSSRYGYGRGYYKGSYYGGKYYGRGYYGHSSGIDQDKSQL